MQSSLPIVWKKEDEGDEYVMVRMRIQPDSSVVLNRNSGVFGMMEIKAKHSLDIVHSHRIDYDKSASSQALRLPLQSSLLQRVKSKMSHNVVKTALVHYPSLCWTSGKHRKSLVGSSLALQDYLLVPIWCFCKTERR